MGGAHGCSPRGAVARIPPLLWDITKALSAGGEIAARVAKGRAVPTDADGNCSRMRLRGPGPSQPKRPRAHGSVTVRLARFGQIRSTGRAQRCFIRLSRQANAARLDVGRENG